MAAEVGTKATGKRQKAKGKKGRDVVLTVKPACRAVFPFAFYLLPFCSALSLSIHEARPDEADASGKAAQVPEANWACRIFRKYGI